jgi:hypothetical protein
MLHVTVTGKVVKVDEKNPQSGRQTTVVWLSERRYENQTAGFVTWIVVIPDYLEKAVQRLAKEGKSIGFTATSLWALDKPVPPENEPVAAVIQAESVFIL